MRRACLPLLALCLLSVADASAQVTLGLKAGINRSDLSIHDADGENVDVKSKTGFVGGAYLQFGLGDVFAVQPEVLYSAQGAKQPVGDATLSLDLTYLSVPLLFMARIPAGDSPIWPILYVGPVVSFEMDCKLKGEVDGSTTSVDCDGGDEPTNRTSGTDVGMTFGGGFDFFFGSIRTQLDARYTIGLNNIDDTDSGSSVKNRGWSFTFGMGYALSP